MSLPKKGYPKMESLIGKVKINLQSAALYFSDEHPCDIQKRGCPRCSVYFFTGNWLIFARMRTSQFASSVQQQDPRESGQHAEKVGCQGAVMQSCRVWCGCHVKSTAIGLFLNGSTIGFVQSEKNTVLPLIGTPIIWMNLGPSQNRKSVWC